MDKNQSIDIFILNVKIINLQIKLPLSRVIYFNQFILNIYKGDKLNIFIFVMSFVLSLFFNNIGLSDDYESEDGYGYGYGYGYGDDELPEESEYSGNHQLIINEILRGSEVQEERDHWIEIYNPTNEEIMLTGWKIKGVTAGGRWIDIAMEEIDAIQPHGYFLLSHYTNSSSSALEIRPQSNKTSILIPDGEISISLQNPSEELSDKILIPVETHCNASVQEYHSLERQWPIGNGLSEENWKRSTSQVNLKEDVINTFATPGTANSGFEMINEVSNINYQIEDLILDVFWENPEHEWLKSINVYQLNEEYEWTMHERENEDFERANIYSRLQIDNFILTDQIAFKITTTDIFNRESHGEEFWIFPEEIIVINEILPNPKSLDTQNEFIEIKNIGNVGIDLYGWEIDDENLEDDNSYYFIDEERDYFLMPGDFLVFYKPETLITLGNYGDGVYLFDDWGDERDVFFYAPDLEGRSWGRDYYNPDEWITFNHPTPNENNIEINNPPVAIIRAQSDTKYMYINVTGEDSYDEDDDKLIYEWSFENGGIDDRKNPTRYTYGETGMKTITLTVTDEYGLFDSTEYIFTASEKTSGSSGNEITTTLINYPTYNLINEFLVNPIGKDTENEWIELFNPTSKAINLSGWYLDDGEKASSPFKFPDNFTLNTGDYYVFSEPNLGLSLKNSSDEVRLLDPNKTAKEVIKYENAKENMSYAKDENGYFLWNKILTPNEKNQFPEPPKNYNKDDVVIDSVLANPKGKDGGNEIIMIKNNLNKDINLEGWKIEDKSGHKYIFSSLIFKAKESKKILQSDFKFTLKNSEEELFLYDPAGNLIDEIKWKNAPNGQWIIKIGDLKDGLQVKVIRVIDGDTIVINWDDRILKVRMLGVDTPETVHPFKPVEFYGKKASEYSKKRLTNKKITLSFDKNKIDRYGRLLAYIYIGDKLFNAELIEKGYGYAYIKYPFKYRDEFIRLEEIAKEMGIGIWQNLKIRKMIELGEIEIIDENDEGEDIDPRPEEDEEDMELLILDDVETQDLASHEEKNNNKCLSNNLKIKSFFPNNIKGENNEYIRLINTGNEHICLKGWKLDDILEKGSKAFEISGGGMAPNSMRTFYKNETKITLNNSDDCVSLIDPMGKLMDQICYEKTHKNEVFTHDEGDWQAKKRSKNVRTGHVQSKKKKKYSKREAIEFLSEFADEQIIGIIQNINEEDEILYIKLENDKIIPIIYGYSPVDINMTKSLLDFKKPVSLEIKNSDDNKYLLSIKQAIQTTSEKNNPAKNTPYIFLTLTILSGGYWWKKMY